MGFELKPAISSQPNTTVSIQPGARQTIRLDPQVRQRYVPPPVEFLKSAEQSAGANIVVSYNGGGWTPEAQNAFEFAVGIWETLITSPITIEVDADFGPLGATILGGAGPNMVVRDFPNAPLSSTWYPVATANKLSNSDQDPGSRGEGIVLFNLGVNTTAERECSNDSFGKHDSFSLYNQYENQMVITNSHLALFLFQLTSFLHSMQNQVFPADVYLSPRLVNLPVAVMF